MQTVCDIFGLSARGGLHVPAARLWLDGKARGDLAFVSQAGDSAMGRGRAICSAELAQLLGKQEGKLFSPPWCERFRLGALHLELLPSGATPGSAMLSIEGTERDILVATTARLDTLPLGTLIPDYDADVLVLDATLAAHPHATVAELRLRVDEALDEIDEGARGIVWLFDDPLVALEVASIVGLRAPLYANLAIKRWHWKYVASGFPVPRIRRLGSRAVPGAFVLWPAGRAAELANRDADDFEWTLVAELADYSRADEVGAERSLPFSRRATGTELDKLVHALGARDVVALGAGAAILSKRLAKDPSRDPGVQMWHLTDDRQLALWTG